MSTPRGAETSTGAGIYCHTIVSGSGGKKPGRKLGTHDEVEGDRTMIGHPHDDCRLVLRRSKSTRRRSTGISLEGIRKWIYFVVQVGSSAPLRSHPPSLCSTTSVAERSCRTLVPPNTAGALSFAVSCFLFC